MFANGGIPMELDHPTDREETCSDRIAAMLPQAPTKDDKGRLICCVDIIDTPCGRIAYQLAKYGFNLGISSRGSGEVIENFNGEEEVDCDSYQFQTFDLVLLPAVKEARLKLMTESLNGKTLKQALNEELNKATPEAKKVMEETLSNLNINYSNIDDKKHEIELKLDSLRDTLDWVLEKGYTHRLTSILNQIEELEKDLKEDKEYTHESDIDKSHIAANDVGATMIKELQDSLLAQQKLEAQMTALQEKLSVCYAKETKYEEEISKYKSAVRNLSEQVNNAKALKTTVTNLQEELQKKDKSLIAEQTSRNLLIESQKVNSNKFNQLRESLNQKDNELRDSKREIAKLNENLKSLKSQFASKEENLNENLSEMKKNLTIKTNEYSRKLSDANKLIEQYRSTAKKAVTKYVESKAIALGIKKEEILNKLPENYSFNDIDIICEDLAGFNLKVSKLPFSLEKINKASITKPKEPLLDRVTNNADTIDESLIRLAENLNK